jgi:hypothetical protein
MLFPQATGGEIGPTGGNTVGRPKTKTGQSLPARLCLIFKEFRGAPEEIRTPDPQIRSSWRREEELSPESL